jgi:hypothetical protein
MSAYQVMTLLLRLAVFAVLVFMAIVVANPKPAAPLISPPYCEGEPDTGFCSLDLSDGREYVIYTDPVTGEFVWFEQSWRDGSP